MEKIHKGIRHLLTALFAINFMYLSLSAADTLQRQLLAESGICLLLYLLLILCIHLCQLRTPFNYLLMNLSTTELLISTTGNPILAYNAFYKWDILNFRSIFSKVYRLFVNELKGTVSWDRLKIIFTKWSRLVFKFLRGSNDYNAKSLFIAVSASLLWLNNVSVGAYFCHSC